MIPVICALLAGLGAHYLYTAIALGWHDLSPVPRLMQSDRKRFAAQEWMTQAGLGGMQLRSFVALTAGVFTIALLATVVVFGAPVPALCVAIFSATAPASSIRRRRQRLMLQAQEAWPRLLEELRIRNGSLGRSLPQALFEVGERSPVEMRKPFAEAHREWLISTDFARTISVLKTGLADPAADVICETLLVANEIGGSEIDARLGALVEDRLMDMHGRKDARAHQAGARFARRFVLFVPLGMAMAGMSVGNGREAFKTPLGQLVTTLAVGLVVMCWVWAGHYMRLPNEERVFPK